MTLDLEMILVFGTLITGLIWLLDSLWWKKKRTSLVLGPDESRNSVPIAHDPWYVEYAKSFFPVLLIVLLLRSFVVEPFRIPSGSMMPTLLVGDFIVVTKYSYGLRLPVVRTRFLETGEPQRGDVMVFRFPENPREDYIKRVVGLPGDHVAYYNKALYINGEQVAMTELESYIGQGSGTVMTGARLAEEQLDNSRYNILFWPNRPSIEGEVLVPDGHYFVLGDNRDNSNDSRFWGFVPEENLVGKAVYIWMNWDHPAGKVDFSRVGTRIQ